MKNLIYIFLLFSSVVFSQNYNYSIEEAQKKTVLTVNNQLEEIEYFNAYFLPVTKKATLQSALDTYGSVRLDKGDYSGVNIVMKSNQKLYGHPSISQVSKITIKAGSSGVYIENIFPSYESITFEAGAKISNCTLKTIKYGTIQATNAMLENNTFFNILGRINFDFSLSGYYRNNKIIKHQIQSVSNQLVVKGNSATPSYGNVHLHTNFLTPNGDVTDINNLQSINFVGLDAEGWNLKGEGTKPLLYAKNIGDIKITDFGGGNGYSPVRTSGFDIDANNLMFLNKYIIAEGNLQPAVVGAKTNLLFYKGKDDPYVRGSGTVTGFDVKAQTDYNSNSKNVVVDGVVQTGLIANSSAISSQILGTKYTPWERPTFEVLPNPLGTNWKTDRIGKPDSTAFIQNLINTNGIANLEEGTYYISSTLTLSLNGAKGIIGKGTGKTVICGLTDDFPLITLAESSTGDNDFKLAFLTLQGGSAGVYAPDEVGMIAFTNIKYVVFRNQNYGIHLRWIFGLDNCFFDHVSFVDCNIGFFQDPHPVYTFDNAGYVDKVVFYGGQYLNCNIGVSMLATRANNLDAWINCKFENNNSALTIGNHNYAIMANCDVINNSGNYTVWGEMSLYNCNFSGNKPAKATFMSKLLFIEGCNFLDSIKMFPNENHYYANYHILNSTITGNVTRTYGVTQALYVNNNLLANPTLSKLLVNVKDNVSSVLINATSNPYPQLLVTQ